MEFKRPKLVSFGKKEKLEEEEKKGKKREESRSSKPRYGTWIFGMETNLDYEFYEIWHEYLVWYGYCLASNLGFVRISSQP